MGKRARRGVRARRVLRRVELWPVAKVALLFHLCCYLVTLGVVAAAWRVILGFGTVKNLERFLSQSSGIESFRIDGPTLFEVVAYGGLVLVGFNTVATVLMAFLYNRLSALFGGLVFSVLTDAPTAVPQGTAVAAGGSVPFAGEPAPRPVVARDPPHPPARRRTRPDPPVRRRPARPVPPRPVGAPAMAADIGIDAPAAAANGALWGDDD